MEALFRQILGSLITLWITQYLYFYFQDIESTPRHLGRRGWGKYSWFSQSLANKTSAAIIWKANKEKTPKQYILAVHPHGVWSIGHLLVSTGCLGTDEVYPPWLRRGLTAKVMFKIPVLRELCLRNNLINASRQAAERCLSRGLSLSVVPGGEREQLLSTPGKELVVLNQRKGFIKLALKYNIPVIPVYCFGENDLTENPKFLFGIRSWVQRKFGVAITYPFTWWGLIPLPFTVYRHPPLRLAFGPPVYYEGEPQSPSTTGSILDKGSNAVDVFHAAYVKALRKLFDECKEEAGFKDRELIIT